MKSFDVFLDSGVNVQFDHDVDDSTVPGYLEIKAAAREKFIEMLKGDGFDVQIEPFFKP